MAGQMFTVRDVLYMYTDARTAYDRFVGIGSNPEQARNAVALLVWLDQCNVPAIQHLPGLSPTAVSLVAAEANSVLDCLRRPEPVVPAIPLISALCQDGDVDPRFFAFHQDLVVRGVADILDGVGSLIFDDHLNKMLRRYQTGLVGNPPELMATYSCLPVAVPEDCRSMFITFSRGAPIDREEIFDYFRQKWGDCVVRVLMEKTAGGSQPMYGRIIFRSEAFVQLVLNGERLVKVTIRHRQIWLRKYEESSVLLVLNLKCPDLPVDLVKWQSSRPPYAPIQSGWPIYIPCMYTNNWRRNRRSRSCSATFQLRIAEVHPRLRRTGGTAALPSADYRCCMLASSAGGRRAAAADLMEDNINTDNMADSSHVPVPPPNQTNALFP
uniref:RRM domain-containing protein n=1 Tax=Oryza glumipatula TaxID=40148 RepID=A0A0D9YCA2_9ORYZ